METCFKILQLKFDQKLTNRCIALTLKISASTVFEVLSRFKATSLPWPLPEAISHAALEKRIFPAKSASASELVMPDLLHFDTEMRKPGVTRQLLWMEYKAQTGELAMGYSHFCRCYREWKKTRRLSMRQEHRAGEKLFIDFCGPTVPVVNPDNVPDRRFIDNLLRHHRENQELPLSRQSEQHSMTSPEHENLRGPGYYH